MIFCGICQELNKVDFGQRESNCKDFEKSKGHWYVKKKKMTKRPGEVMIIEIGSER